MLSTLFRDICAPDNVYKPSLPTKVKQSMPKNYAERVRTTTFKTVYESAPTNVDRVAVSNTTCTFRLGYYGRPNKITAHLSRMEVPKVNTTEQFDLLLPNPMTGVLEWNQWYIFTLTNLQPNSYYKVTWSSEFAELAQSYKFTAVFGFSDITVPRIYSSPVSLHRYFYTHGPPNSPAMDIFGQLSFGLASANAHESIRYELTLTSKEPEQPDIVKSDILNSPTFCDGIPPGQYEGVLRSMYSTGDVYYSDTFTVTIV